MDLVLRQKTFQEKREELDKKIAILFNQSLGGSTESMQADVEADFASFKKAMYQREQQREWPGRPECARETREGQGVTGIARGCPGNVWGPTAV